MGDYNVNTIDELKGVTTHMQDYYLLNTIIN